MVVQFIFVPKTGLSESPEYFFSHLSPKVEPLTSISFDGYLFPLQTYILLLAKMDEYQDLNYLTSRLKSRAVFLILNS